MARLGIDGGTALGGLQLAALGAGAAIVGIAAYSVKAASGFDQAMHKVAGLTTLIQSSGHDMQYWSDQILALAPQIDVAPTQLAQALYFVASAGIPADKVMSVLRYSAMAAAATMGDMSKTADLVTSAMNAYKKQGMDAATATNVIVDAIKNGKVEMQALQTSFAFVATTGLSAKFSLQEVAAAVSTLTQVSGNSAARRVQMDLDNLIRRLGDVGGIASTAKKLKLPFDEAQFAGMGMIQRLQTLMQMTGFTTNTLDQMRAAAHGNEQVYEQMALKAALASTAFKSLAGGAAAMIPSVILMNDKGVTFNQIYAEMRDKTDKVNAAFNTMRESTGQKWNMFEVTLQSLAITIGLHLLPAVNGILMALIGAGRGLVAFMASTGGWEKLKTALIGFAGVFAVLLGPALLNFMVSVVLVKAAAVALILVFSATLGPIIQQLVAHFGGWHAILGHVGDALHKVGDVVHGVTTFFRDHALALDALKAVFAAIGIEIMVAMVPAWIALGGAALTAAGGMLLAAAPFLPIIAIIALVVLAVMELTKHWTQVKAAAQGFATAIGGFFSGLGTHVRGALDGIGSSVGDFLGDTGAKIGGFFSGLGTVAHDGTRNALAQLGTFASGVGTAFQLAYHHSYLFQHMVDAVTGYFKGLWHDAQTIGGWIGGAWDWTWEHISSNARLIWAGIVAYFDGQVAEAGKWMSAIGGALSAAWTWVWDHITSNVKAIWASIGAWFRGQVAVAGTWMEGIAGALKKPIQDLAQWLFDAGKNLLHMLAKGIQAQLGEVRTAAGAVAGVIGNLIGFHSPTKEGPGSTAHQWAPALVGMFARGLAAGVPTIGAAATRLAAAAGLSGTVGVGFSGAGGASLAGAATGAGAGGAMQVHNWAGAFPNATNAAQIEQAIRSVQRTDYRRARRAGFGGGLRSGIGGGR